MSNFFNRVEIKNFKSVKNINFDCKRVNVFIGKPNVGKSNILEALSLLGAHYSTNEKKLLSEFIRYEEISNLFYDEDLLKTIEVNTDEHRAILRFRDNDSYSAELLVGGNQWVNMSIKKTHKEEVSYGYADANAIIEPYYNYISATGMRSKSPRPFLSNHNPVKKYHFNNNKEISNKFPQYLLPPNGNNLFTIVDHNKELRKEISEIFSEYGLNFVAYKKESKFEIEKNIDGYITKYHYSGTADTFQRLIFYYAAIDSNKDSVLILEEPEVHSFPPYTRDLSERIIGSTTNQFFITTHSPYLLQNLIENLDSTELNVFITYFEDYQTKIKPLSSEDLRKASEFSVDLFYNLKQFVKNA